MKVYLCDYSHHKTTRHWIKYLEANHELVMDQYFNPVYAEWADVIFVEWCEGAAQEASLGERDYEGVYDHAGVRGEPEKQYTGHFNWKGKPLYIRPIDIDVYYGHFRNVHWENVTGLIYIAPHIKELLMEGITYPDTLKIDFVPLSVDVNEWTYRERDGTGKQIAWINHNWSAKGLPLMIQALKKLVDYTKDPEWVLHIVENERSTEWWLHRYIKEQIKMLGLESNVRWHDSVPSIDQFLDDKDYLVSSSHKEAFSLILAEAMAKGIKAVTHSWWGADKLWPKEMVWYTIDEFPIKLVLGAYDSEKYRALAESYSSEKEIERLREITGL